VFADRRQLRTDSALGASMVTSHRMSEWPENTGRLTVFIVRMVPHRDAQMRNSAPTFPLDGTNADPLVWGSPRGLFRTDR
jgi:hypothetical protein